MLNVKLMFFLFFIISCGEIEKTVENEELAGLDSNQVKSSTYQSEQSEKVFDDGSYGGNIQAPSFSNDYKEAMYMAVRFFGAQRCGKTNNWMLLENDDIEGDRCCHVKDEFNGNDLTGGWHDCGDHIKVAHTMGYSAVCLLSSYDIWPSAFNDYYSQNYHEADGIPDVLNEVKIATDYFMKSFPDPNTFLYYVGNASNDHKEWFNSAEQSTLANALGGEKDGPRDVMFTTDAGGSTAANYATSLAFMSMKYREFDPVYADKCLEYAKNIYLFAKKHCDTVIVIKTYYPNVSKDWWDELSLSASILYRATGEEEYKTDANYFYRGKYNSNYPESWDTVADLAYYYMVKYSTGRENIYLLLVRNVLSGLKVVNSYGLPWNWAGLSKWGTNKLFCGSAFAAALYSNLREDGFIEEDPSLSDQDVKNYNKRIVDYMLGDNEFGHPFLHGFKGDKTFRIHHRNAMGRTFKDGSQTTKEEKNSVDIQFASGGLIGGPIVEGSFNNLVEDSKFFKETEGGCDYNASFIAALANLAAQ